MSKKIKVKREPTAEERAAEQAEAEEKKALEEAGVQDEFQQKGFELVEWMQEHSGVVMAGIGLVVAFGVALGVAQIVRHNTDENASVAWLDAVEILKAPVGDASDTAKKGPRFDSDAARNVAAREAFQGVAANHSGSDVALLSRLYEANLALRVGDGAAARIAYERFLADAAADEPLRFLALDGLSASLEAQGDLPGAAATLEKWIALPGKVAEDVALLRLARLHQAAGDPDKAREAANRLVQGFPQSKLLSDAEELIESLPAQGS